jgi:hypothetical protein
MAAKKSPVRPPDAASGEKVRMAVERISPHVIESRSVSRDGLFFDELASPRIDLARQ